MRTHNTLELFFAINITSKLIIFDIIKDILQYCQKYRIQMTFGADENILFINDSTPLSKYFFYVLRKYEMIHFIFSIKDKHKCDVTQSTLNAMTLLCFTTRK